MRRIVVKKSIKHKESLSNVLNSINTAKAECEAINKAKDGLLAEIKDVNNRLFTLQSDYEKKENALSCKLAELEKEIASKLSLVNEIETLTKEKSNKLENLKNTESVVNASLDHFSSLIHKAKNELANVLLEREKAQEDFSVFKSEWIKLDESKKAILKDIDTLNKSREDVVFLKTNEIKALENKISRLSSEYSEINFKVNSKLSELDSTNLLITSKLEFLKTLDRDIKDKKTELKEIDDNILKQKEISLSLIQKEQLLNLKEKEITKLYHKAGLTI